MSASLVHLEGAAIGYGRRPLLDGLDVAVAPGDFLAVVGPNGGGKTTLLRTLLGALAPVAGRVARREGLAVGYVPQREHVDTIWPFTAGEVTLMGRVPALGPWRRPGRADRDEARRALARVGVEHLVQKRFGELSGGQRQRTLIARALAADPELLALDEPTSGMDPAAELALMDLLRDLHRGGRLAIVMVSHRLEAVANYARTLAFVDKDQALFRVGTLEQMLLPDALGALYGRPVAVREVDGRRVVYPTNGSSDRSEPSTGAGERRAGEEGP
ncbi:MAG TPA: metal ABC transporter ATP-binding protein [Anaeromyxobacter sp.]|nr:metal ABC transporter ATP-binding protein [Anaeromyxobacter sp.]